MRSGTSFFDLTVYKKTVARFWPLWAAYFALWLILLPLNGLMMLRLDAQDKLANHLRSFSYLENFAEQTVPELAQAAVVIAVVAGALVAMAVFSHLYNAKSANFFGSLPIRREGLFTTHYLAGLSFLLVPSVVVFLLTLAVEAAGGCVDMKALLFWLGMNCGASFFFYSLAVFCGMFTGHLLALPAFYAIVNVFAAGVTGLFYLILKNFYYGFAGYSGWVNDAVVWLTPAQKMQEATWRMWDYVHTPGGAYEQVLSLLPLGVAGIYALAAAALTVGAFFLYRARRLESAGDVVSVRPMRPVFKYGMAFCVGMVFGVGTAEVLSGGEVTLMIAILVWGVVGYFAAQMLLDKSFRVFKKWKGAAAVSGVFVLLFLVVGFDLTGFETRVPDPADVEFVHASGLDAVYFGDDGDRAFLYVDDPGQIELLTALHRAAVEQRDEEDKARDPLEGVSTSLRLIYTLNNGSTLSRSYSVWLALDDVAREGTAAWCVERLYHDTDLYWEVYGFGNLEGNIDLGMRLDSAEFNWYDEDWGMQSAVVGYGADARRLLDAVEEDLRAGRIGARTLAGANEDDRHGYGPRDSLTFRVTDPATGDTADAVEIALQETATSTLAVLEELAGKMDSAAAEQMLRDGGWIG